MGKKKNLNRSISVSVTKEEQAALTEELVVKRKGGGSIIRFKPVFSDDSRYVNISLITITNRISDKVDVCK
jgi:hypothetical protein